MRRLALLFITVLLLAGAIQAQPPIDLTEKANYFPVNTGIYAAIRTDEAYFDTLGGTLDQLSGDLLGEVDLRGFLDELANELSGDTFDAGIRPWLGDNVALGVILNEDIFSAEVPPVLLAIDTSDIDAARAWVDENLGSDLEDYLIEDRAGFTIYIPSRESLVAFGFSEDTLFMAATPDLIPGPTREARLGSVEGFSASIAALPQPPYNALIYVDSAAVQQLSLDMLEMSGQQVPGALAQLSTNLSAQAIGFTLLDDTTLAVDMVTLPLGDMFGEDLALNMTPARPLDMDFAAHIPIDAGLVLWLSEFGPTTQRGLDNIAALSGWLRDNGGLLALAGLPMDMIPSQQAALLSSFTPDDIINALRIGIAGLTGLSLERDILPALPGDAAAFLRFDYLNEELPILPDGAVVFGAADAEAAADLVDSFYAASQAYETGYTREIIGEDGRALVLPLASVLSETYLPELDILAGALDDTFALGTRAAVQDSLMMQAGLDSSVTYQTASTYFLPDAQQVAYIGAGSLSFQLDNVIRSLRLNDPFSLDRDLVDLRNLLALLESATISAVVDEEGGSIGRLALTLADDPSYIEFQPRFTDEQLGPTPVMVTEEAVRVEPFEPTVPPRPEMTTMPPAMAVTIVPLATPTPTPGS